MSAPTSDSNQSAEFPKELPEKSVDFPTVFAEELKRIKKWRKNRDVPVDDGADLVGLAFSGGGIRSATFNLGVLQALAKLGILRYVDYLSTVSGGGYIGGWLTAMLHRLGAGGMNHVEAELDPDKVKQDNLPQKAIAHLRAYSNYLTPKVSLLSADTWSLFTIWSRNTLLNLVTLVAGIAALILFGRFVGLNSMVHAKWTAGTGWTWAAFGVAAVTLALNLTERLPRKLRNDSWVQRLVLLPAFAGAVLMTLETYARTITSWLLVGVVLFALFLALQLLSGFWEWFLHGHYQKSAKGWIGVRVLDALLQVGVAAVSGFVTTWLFYAVSRGALHFDGKPFTPWLVLTVGPPAILAAVSLGVIVNVGLMGRDMPDDKREWVGRLGAWAMIYGAGWLLFFGVAFLGPLALKAGWSVFAAWAKATITLAWVGATIGSLLAAKSAKTGSDQGGGTMNLVALAGPWVFLLGFVSLIGLGVHQLTVRTVTPEPPAASAGASATAKLTQSGWTITATFDSRGGQKKAEGSPCERYWNEMNAQVRSSLLWKNPYDKGDIDWYQGLLEVMLLAMAIALVMSWRVDINEFSLHNFYKNRLVRCYLGASRKRQDRRQNPFTKFDSNDDFPLNHLDDPNFSGPFPIINATLNLSSGGNLAWQERKAAPFIFTPVYSGYDTGGDSSGTSASRFTRVCGDADASPVPAYYPTQLVAKTAYKAEQGADAGAGPEFASDGILLGATVAISGAAANPNQGYHTSTAVAFLMTVFDVRLGWWLGNPRRPKVASSNSPVFGLGYTLAELFGTTCADSAYVNLSDGGHFDNMGLYELVRRRCRYIIVCDAEQDENLIFDGLSRAIRMCRTDFGTKITIDLSPFARKPDNQPVNFSGSHYAVGSIVYADAPRGKLVYLKASLTGKDEPADVLGYHNQVPQFPHESTADQWFDESQFESYRALGYSIAHEALGGRDPLSEANPKEAFFRNLI
ncbi:MAG: hypothetical protein WBL61_18450 [Bryobacteraceae bacterium]